MTSSSKKKEYMPDGLGIFIISICLIIIAGVTLLGDKIGNDSEQATTTRDCSYWKEKGSAPIPVLITDGNERITISKETFILELDSEWSPWIIPPSSYWRGLNEYEGSPEVKTSDTVMTERSAYSDLSEADSVQFRGEGCLLITTSKDMYERLLQLPPK